MEAVERLPISDRVTAKVAFAIVQPDTSTSSRLSEPAGLLTSTARSVYLLALGANVGELTRANSDAQRFAAAMGRLLRLPSDHIRVVENARVKDFRAGMEWLREQAGPEDLAVVFFSGHGSTITDDDGDEADGLDEVFVMYDAQEHQPALVRHVVRDDDFATWLQAIRAGHVLVFIDACFSGGLHKSLSTTVTNARPKFFMSGELGRSAPALVQGASPPDLPGGIDGLTTGKIALPRTAVFAAAQERQYALETHLGGLFTIAFLAELQQARGGDLTTVFQRVAQRVHQASKQQQTPVLVGNAALAATLNVQ